MAEKVNVRNSLSRVLLTGATSQVGVFALPKLLREGMNVTALSRRVSMGLPHAGRAEPANVRWLHPDALSSAGTNQKGRSGNDGLQQVEVIFSCGPIVLAQGLLDSCPVLRRVVCISSSSVFSKSDSGNMAERALISDICKSEQSLAEQCVRRDIRFLLLRPTLIYGCGLDQNISRIARLVQRFRFLPVAGNASGLRQPIHAEDLADLGLAAIKSESLSSMESPVGGGSVLSYRQMVEKVFIALGLTPRILSFPPALLASLANLAVLLPGSGGLNAEFVYRQNRDLVFDDSAIRRALAFSTRPFAPTSADFEIPENLRLLQPQD